MNEKLKDAGKKAGTAAAAAGLALVGAWIAGRPRVARMLARRPVIAKALAVIGIK